MDAYWLEQTEADMPAESRWLSAGEMSRLVDMRFCKRRADWRLGRWTAKRAVASCLNLSVDERSLQDIEIQATPSGAPELLLFSQQADVTLSLSHRAGKALCVVALSGASLGCDLELVELRDDSFVADFFTASEQKLIERSPANERPVLTTLLWSAKESALKALRVGLRLSTTCLEVSPTDALLHAAKQSSQHRCNGWSPLSLRGIGGRSLHGWWRCANNIVRTVIFQPAAMTDSSLSEVQA